MSRRKTQHFVKALFDGDVEGVRLWRQSARFEGRNRNVALEVNGNIVFEPGTWVLIQQCLAEHRVARKAVVLEPSLPGEPPTQVLVSWWPSERREHQETVVLISGLGAYAEGFSINLK